VHSYTVRAGQLQQKTRQFAVVRRDRLKISLSLTEAEWPQHALSDISKFKQEAVFEAIFSYFVIFNSQAMITVINITVTV
jgi:hypothetical protein